MKAIYLNLKRFDIPRQLDGINDLASPFVWAEKITTYIDQMGYENITVFFPEMHLMNAIKHANNINIGAQTLHYKDVVKGGNFGAFTTLRTASSLKAINISNVIIGHLEERIDLGEINRLANGDLDVNEILNQKMLMAQKENMKILYCIGEKSEEQDNKYDVLKNQLDVGLKGINLKNVTIAYEPVWAIGVGKTPPTKEYILDIVKHIKSLYDVNVVYGGGLKLDNAEMLASIEELDGGLIALTRFGSDFGFYLDDFKEIVDTYYKGVKK